MYQSNPRDSSASSERHDSHDEPSPVYPVFHISPPVSEPATPKSSSSSRRVSQLVTAWPSRIASRLFSDSRGSSRRHVHISEPVLLNSSSILAPHPAIMLPPTPPSRHSIRDDASFHHYQSTSAAGPNASSEQTNFF